MLRLKKFRYKITAVRGFSSPTQNYKFVNFRKEGKVAIIELNDPKRLNALTADMGDEFSTIVDSICLDCEDINCVIVTGAGRAFSAGGDLQFLRDRHHDTPSRNAIIMRRFYERFLSVRRLPVPVIAAINGPAIGAGLCLALACDLRVAAEDAPMGVTFTKIGLHPGMGSTHTIRNIAGSQVAAKMLLTGDVVSGREAKDLGLVLSCHPTSAVMDSAFALAHSISAAGPIAVRSAVKSLRNQDDEALERSLWREADAQAQCYASKDLLEGVNAVAEKRKPVFSNGESLKE